MFFPSCCVARATLSSLAESAIGPRSEKSMAFSEQRKDYDGIRFLPASGRVQSLAPPFASRTPA